MCTVIEKRKMNHPLIAKHDMKVYKICKRSSFEDSAVSIIVHFGYEKDELYTAEFSYHTDRTSTWDTVERKYGDKLKRKVYVEGGFHSLRKPDMTRNGTITLFSMCVFIIPKGAEYYKNGAGMIVSNQIIFKKYLKLE